MAKASLNQIKRRLPRVIISDHAMERWLERAKRRPYNLRAELDMKGGIIAQVYLHDTAWVVATFVDTPPTEQRVIG